jgi:hypothetical protein
VRHDGRREPPVFLWARARIPAMDGEPNLDAMSARALQRLRAALP